MAHHAFSPTPAPAPGPSPASPVHSPSSHHAPTHTVVVDPLAEIAKALESPHLEIPAGTQEQVVLICAGLAILYGLYNICKVLGYQVYSKEEDIEMQRINESQRRNN